LDVETASLFAPFYAWFPNEQTDAVVKFEGVFEYLYSNGETELWEITQALKVEPSVVNGQKGFYILIPELSDSSSYYVKKTKKAKLIVEIEGVQSESRCDFILVTAPQEYSGVKFKIPQKFSFVNCSSPFEHDIEYQDEEFKVKKFYGRCTSTGIAHVEWEEATSVEWEDSISSERFTLFQNHPNPFNQETIIRYSVPWDCMVKLSIYNLLGERVRTLVNELQRRDDYEVRWDGRDEWGKNVASGVFIYKIEVGEFSESKKMVIVK
jgi:hypothetical protein